MPPTDIIVEVNDFLLLLQMNACIRTLFALFFRQRFLVSMYSYLDQVDLRTF